MPLEETEWQRCHSAYGVSSGPALQRKSDTVIDARCNRVVAVMPQFLTLRVGLSNGKQNVKQRRAAWVARAFDRAYPHPDMTPTPQASYHRHGWADL